jgi:hypothetical protein
MRALRFVDDVAAQELPTNGATTVRLYVGDLYKRCTKCGDMMRLLDAFGRFRRMSPDSNEFRTQAQCKICRGTHDD